MTRARVPRGALSSSRRRPGACPPPYPKIEVEFDGDGAEGEETRAMEVTTTVATSTVTTTQKEGTALPPPAPAPQALASALAFEEVTCGICLELVAAAHAVAGCGHVFCGGCLAKSIEIALSSASLGAHSRPSCAHCRAPIDAAPTRVCMLDNIVACLAAAGELVSLAGNSLAERVAAFDGGAMTTTAGGGGVGNNNDETAYDARCVAPNAAEAARIFAGLSRQPPPLRAPASVEEESDDDDNDNHNDDEIVEDPPVGPAAVPEFARHASTRELAVRDLQDSLVFHGAEAMRAIESFVPAARRGGGGEGGGGGAA